MISSKIKKLRHKFIKFNIDGYVVPKNDMYFNEYSSPDRLKLISNFDGSAGLAIILRTKIIYLLMEGIQYKLDLSLEKTLVLLKFTKNYHGKF